MSSYIDSGDPARNIDLFEQLSAQQGQIETAYGSSLSWEELPTKKASRVADYREGCSVTEEQRYHEFIEWFFDAGTRLREALNTVSIN